MELVFKNRKNNTQTRAVKIVDGRNQHQHYGYVPSQTTDFTHLYGSPKNLLGLNDNRVRSNTEVIFLLIRRQEISSAQAG